jgi:hypothetical protein
VILAAASLSGCSQLLNDLHKVHEESYASYAEAADGWVGVDIPAWIPDDATALHNYATNDETQSVVGVTSSDEPVGCDDSPRTGLPFATTDWAPSGVVELPDGGLIDDVLLCGDYEVVAYGEGWVGWFAASEEGQTPGWARRRPALSGGRRGGPDRSRARTRSPRR